MNSKLQDIRQAVEAATGGEWSWHNRVWEKEGGAVIGYDRLETEYEEGGGDDVISWRKAAWIAVNEPDARLIENAKDWLTDLLAIAEAAQAMRAEIKNIPQTVMTYHMYDVVADYDKAAAKLKGE